MLPFLIINFDVNSFDKVKFRDALSDGVKMVGTQDAHRQRFMWLVYVMFTVSFWFTIKSEQLIMAGAYVLCLRLLNCKL